MLVRSEQQQNSSISRWARVFVGVGLLLIAVAITASGLKERIVIWMLEHGYIDELTAVTQFGEINAYSQVLGIVGATISIGSVVVLLRVRPRQSNE